MEELQDLFELSKRLTSNYQQNFSAKERRLPDNFKSIFTRFNYNDVITYYDYSLEVDCSSGLKIFIPNQWIYIASFFVEYYLEIRKYRNAIISVLSKDVIQKCKDDEAFAKSLSVWSSFSSTNKSKLIRFLSDYSWWGGGKTIDRNDFYVSPILSLAGLVNASQSYVTDICKNLADQPEAFEVLKNASSNMGLSASLSSSVPLSTLNPASLTSFNQQLLSAIRTKPFVLLAGISGTGKSRIVRELAKACWPDDEEQRNAQEPKNFMMIQVRPNWHDSTELIGYVSRINGEKYIAGDFIKFVARAWQDPERPYFLCLDEMNLAPVEQYFAEYLSIIESRKLKNGKIVTDAIIRPDYKSVDGEKIVKEYYDNLIKELIVECPDDKKHALYIQFKTDGISIPQNLIVIGTVNMDETTYSFSRKVLDRAMTLEMNEVDMWGGLVDDESFNFGNLEDILANAVSDEKVAYQQDKDLCDKVLKYLENVNSKLEGTPFKIAYRTRNEFLMYALNRKSLAKDDEDVYIKTIDEMTSMKILSRIEGDFEKTSRVLSDIKKILENQSLAMDNSISLKKIDDMEKKLKSGYTSYWA